MPIGPEPFILAGPDHHQERTRHVDVLHALEARRSIKSFDPAAEMPADHRREILRLAALSPTAFNLQHVRYVVVGDPELRRALREVSFGQAQVTDASLLVAVCAKVSAWQQDAERCWDHLEPAAREGVVSMIRNFYADQPQLQRDEALRSCGLAAQSLMLAGQGLGYASCPMDGFDFAAVARLLNLPDDHLLCMFVALGTALEPARPRGGKLPVDEVVIENRFPA